MPDPTLESVLRRLADALDRFAPPTPGNADLDAHDAFIWRAEGAVLEAVGRVTCVDLDLLKGIDRVRDILLDNTARFTAGLPANNALLWGARGMGKSSLIKAVHARLNAETPHALALIELHREDTASLPRLLGRLRGATRRFVVFCDDLSFDDHDTSYKSLKAMLEGGIEGRPANVIFYATSNRRHMIPRDMIENERAAAISATDVVDDKVSLSDRFGLWLGFHGCTQEVYLDIVEGYAAHFGLNPTREALRADAAEWAMTRGARSGRVAWQFVQDLAGRLGVHLD